MWSELSPGACCICGATASDRVACYAHAVPLDHGSRCGRCAARLPAGARDGARCWKCRRSAPAQRSTRVVGDYEEPLRTWILAWKHGPRGALVEPLAAILFQDVVGAERRDALFVPVPVHPWRRLERGADGVTNLARALARHADGDLVRALCRTRATPPQGEPGSSSRSANVAGAFALRERDGRRIRGRDLVLVDDVVTSGATVHEAARVLRRGGANRVDVVALARAPGG